MSRPIVEFPRTDESDKIKINILQSYFTTDSLRLLVTINNGHDRCITGTVIDVGTGLSTNSDNATNCSTNSCIVVEMCQILVMVSSHGLILQLVR